VILSDQGSAVMKHSHIHAEGRKRSEKVQITVQQLRNTITYMLRAGRGWKTIRSLFSSYTVTYMLRAGRGQKTIRSLFSSYETQSHTS